MRTILMLVAALLFAAPAAAKVVQHAQAGVSVNLPDGWQIEGDGDLLSAESPDDKIVALFIGVPKAQFEAVLGQLETMISEAGIKNSEIGEPAEGELNGMPALMVEGKGTFEGKPVEMGIVLAMPLTGENALIMLGLSEKGAADAQAKVLEKMLNSIKPL